MEQDDDYTFVTIDSGDTSDTSSFIVDVSADDMMLDAVTVDGGMISETSDFITLADDTEMLSDADMLGEYSVDMDGEDISFLL